MNDKDKRGTPPTVYKQKKSLAKGGSDELAEMIVGKRGWIRFGCLRLEVQYRDGGYHLVKQGILQDRKKIKRVNGPAL